MGMYLRRMLVVLTLIAVPLTVPAVAVADEDGISRHERLTRQMVNMEFNKGVFDEISAQLAQTILVGLPEAFQARIGRDLSAVEQEHLQAVVMGVVRDVYSQDMWEESMVPIYMKYLTADEVAAILRFYETPVGDKLLSLQGTVMREGNSARQQLLSEHNDTFTARFMEVLAEEFPDWDLSTARPTAASYVH